MQSITLKNPDEATVLSLKIIRDHWAKQMPTQSSEFTHQEVLKHAVLVAAAALTERAEQEKKIAERNGGFY